MHTLCHRLLLALTPHQFVRKTVVHKAALLLVATCYHYACLAEALESPDGKVQLTVALSEQGEKYTLKYTLAYDGSPVISDSALLFQDASGNTIGEHLRWNGNPRTSSHDSTWRPIYGERSKIRDHYNQLRLPLTDVVTGHEFDVTVRCYDAGAALRVTLRTPKANAPIRISEERSEFRFTGDHVAWSATSAQGNHRRSHISEISGRVERPLTVQIDANLFAAVAEANLDDYSTMQLRHDKEDPYCIVSQLGGAVEAKGQLQTPWRVIMLGRSAGDLLENNYLLLNLNEPCAIEDTSWIKPGKVIREVTLTTKGAKACIDFAQQHNFQFVEFDAGWYGHEYSEDSDATTVTLDEKRSAGPFDLHYAIAYAKERDIGIIVYVNRRALERQLDDILPLYKEWGIAGVKYGFVQTESQHWTRWLHEAVKKAAAHQLMVDVHDNYRPTGFSRTFPNLMTQEGVRGDESTPSSSQTIITLFTRSLAGAADQTICYFDSRVTEHWSHGHQLAKAVCVYSPWQFIYWYDTPLSAEQHPHPSLSRIVDSPELEFFAKVPTVWDETRVLRGKIGEYAVIARRSGQDWFIGAMNAEKQREFAVPLRFLASSTSYQARIYRDDPHLDTATKVRIENAIVDSESELRIELQPNGGQAIWLRPERTSEVAAHPRRNSQRELAEPQGSVTE